MGHNCNESPDMLESKLEEPNISGATSYTRSTTEQGDKVECWYQKGLGEDHVDCRIEWHSLAEPAPSNIDKQLP